MIILKVEATPQYFFLENKINEKHINEIQKKYPNLIITFSKEIIK